MYIQKTIKPEVTTNILKFYFQNKYLLPFTVVINILLIRPIRAGTVEHIKNFASPIPLASLWVNIGRIINNINDSKIVIEAIKEICFFTFKTSKMIKTQAATSNIRLIQIKVVDIGKAFLI